MQIHSRLILYPESAFHDHFQGGEAPSEVVVVSRFRIQDQVAVAVDFIYNVGTFEQKFLCLKKIEVLIPHHAFYPRAPNYAYREGHLITRTKGTFIRCFRVVVAHSGFLSFHAQQLQVTMSTMWINVRVDIRTAIFFREGGLGEGGAPPVSIISKNLPGGQIF